jgi:uracil-DNA glycosylase
MTSASAPFAEILRFYAETGLDHALEELPQDRFAEALRQTSLPLREARTAPPEPTRAAPETARSPQPPRRQEPQPAARALPAAAVPDEGQVLAARELAASAASLEELRALIAGFEGCNLKATAKNLVFADGNPAARIMFVGEAPGRDEDIAGLPFVGRSGQLLDRMLAAIGLDRSSAYIANVIPWRPPGNRTPTPQETEICRPFIQRQVELVAPAVLVTLGGPSSKVLLETPDGILKLRGTWRTHRTPGGVEIATMPTLHPAYLLRNPAHKRLAWRDFLQVKKRLGVDT